MTQLLKNSAPFSSCNQKCTAGKNGLFVHEIGIHSENAVLGFKKTGIAPQNVAIVFQNLPCEDFFSIVVRQSLHLTKLQMIVLQGKHFNQLGTKRSYSTVIDISPNGS